MKHVTRRTELVEGLRLVYPSQCATVTSGPDSRVTRSGVASTARIATARQGSGPALVAYVLVAAVVFVAALVVAAVMLYRRG